MKKLILLNSLPYYFMSFFLVIIFTMCDTPSDPNSYSAQNENDFNLDKQRRLLPVSELSTEEISGLIFMREEEKLARDVYQYLYAKWNLDVFETISLSEVIHLVKMKMLLDKYSLQDPVVSDAMGDFTNEELKALYVQLTSQGENSVEEALLAGALIEEIDILDFQEQLGGIVDNADIAFVYENLMTASENHLRAFVSNLLIHGVEYTPVYLDQEYYDAIISSESGRGQKGGS